MYQHPGFTKNKKMELKDKAKMLIYCGILHDIAEKSNEKETKRQLEDIRIKIEIILSKDAEIRKLINQPDNE